MKKAAIFALCALAAAVPALAAPAADAPKADPAEIAKVINEKLAAKYRADVDRSMDRLWEKVKEFPKRERDRIFASMRRSVARKIEEVGSVAGVGEARRDAAVGLLSYVTRKLEALSVRK